MARARAVSCVLSQLPLGGKQFCVSNDERGTPRSATPLSPLMVLFLFFTCGPVPVPDGNE